MVLLQRCKSLSLNWLLLLVALPCAAWSSGRGTKYCPTLDSYCQYFTLCCIVLLQRYKALSHNWLLLSVLYLVLHGPLAEVQSTVPQLTLSVSALPCAAWSSCRDRLRSPCCPGPSSWRASSTGSGTSRQESSQSHVGLILDIFSIGHAHCTNFSYRKCLSTIILLF